MNGVLIKVISRTIFFVKQFFCKTIFPKAYSPESIFFSEGRFNINTQQITHINAWIWYVYCCRVIFWFCGFCFFERFCVMDVHTFDVMLWLKLYIPSARFLFNIKHCALFLREFVYFVLVFWKSLIIKVNSVLIHLRIV